MAVNTGLKNEAKISELLVKVSEAITTKNDFGVHIFSGSVVDDGIISGKLQKPKYDIAEIQKTVDIVITELLPPEVPELPDTVLRSVYNPVTQSVIDLTFQVERLNTLVTNLNADNITSGTFNIANKLVQLDSIGRLPAISGNLLTALNASNFSGGTLADARLSANVTVQGNTFNGVNQLVQLDGTSRFPAANGSLITDLNFMLPVIEIINL